MQESPDSRLDTRQPATRAAEAELDQLRGEIDRFDGWILALLRARGEVVREIARLKRRNGLRTRDPNREEEMLRALTRVPPSPFSAGEVREVFQAVFHVCLRLQETER
ncbi:MAG TPA: chorismate mutase [Thermoanaerobaculia bacterium]|jgi:3-deoxy-7-phosphoheptulonate synthase/chorismate mutase|nr:chorismate mutase [Thermoanaerobaculia bacterium]